jgi:putative intracellular protease/amidase
MTGKVVIVLTSSTGPDTWESPTGYWLEELAEPYYAFTSAGYEVELVSIQGGKPPLDAASTTDDMQTENTRKMSADAAIQEKLSNTKALSTLGDVAKNFDGAFIAGGHGTCFDFPESKELQQAVEGLLAAGKVVGVVCHGPTALVGCKAPDGEPLVKGKKVTGFSNEEEHQVGKGDKIPFLLEDKLKELGADYSKGPAWSSYVVVDGHLVTGQNPKSSLECADKVIELLGARHGVKCTC